MTIAIAENICTTLDGKWFGEKGKCHCPAHDDKSASLSVTFSDDKILFHCFAGCSQMSVFNAVLALNLFPARARRSRSKRAVSKQAVEAVQSIGYVSEHDYTFYAFGIKSWANGKTFTDEVLDEIEVMRSEMRADEAWDQIVASWQLEQDKKNGQKGSNLRDHIFNVINNIEK